MAVAYAGSRDPMPRFMLMIRSLPTRATNTISVPSRTDADVVSRTVSASRSSCGRATSQTGSDER